MTYVLTHRQRGALNALSKKQNDVMPYWQFLKIGRNTLNRLVDIGLAETGLTNRRRDEIGWRITDDGWRCIYGKPYADIIAPGALPPQPFEIWSWPPTRP